MATCATASIHSRGVSPAAQASIKQFDLGRYFGEQRIERLAEELEPRHLGVAQIDHDAGALSRLDARLMHRLFER